MFDRLRADYHRHESNILNPALWAVLNYKFGRWALSTRPAPVRFFLSLIYGLIKWIVIYAGNIRLSRLTNIGKDLQLVHIGNILIHPESIIGDRLEFNTMSL